jgi:hypothetical protein
MTKDEAWERWKAEHPESSEEQAFLAGFEAGANATLIEVFEATARARERGHV